MQAAFETFVRDLADLREGEETVLALRSLEPGRHKYFGLHVRGMVMRPPLSGEDMRPLRVRSMVGNVYPGEWYIKIIEFLPQRIPGRPYGNAFDAMQEAWGGSKVGG